MGPGFDVLGLALQLRNELHVRVLDKKSGPPLIRIVGEGEKSLPSDERNGIYKTMKGLFARANKKMPKVDLVCVNRIPLARGLGSSSAAYLSGLLAANRLLGDRYSKKDILNFATRLEGHPDNVAPALLGGVRASGVYDAEVATAALPTPKLKLVVAVPAFELSTKKARRVVPKSISMKDAIANLSAVALMTAALSGDDALLGRVLNDRGPAPYRSKLIPGFYQVKRAALKSGAVGVILSGAGPTMLAFARAGHAKSVAKAMTNAFLKAGVESKTMTLEIDRKGAVVK